MAVTLDKIPESEVRVLAPLADGKSNQDIADATGLTLHTVQTYVNRLYLRTGAGNRVQLARWYLQQTGATA